MSERLPKPLRRLAAANAQHQPYWNAFLQEDYCHADGEPWPCLSYRQNRPAKCRCSHIKHAGQCWSRACGCREYRPEETAVAPTPPTAAPRLPEHLRTDDVNDYLRQKGEL